MSAALKYQRSRGNRHPCHVNDCRNRSHNAGYTVHGSRALDANTLRTSDWEMPNCRAISAGLTPALNAARTAFTCPRVKEIAATSTLRLGKDLPVDAERFGTDSRRVLVRRLGD